MWNATDPELCRNLFVGSIINVKISPLEFVVQGLNFGAGVNVIFHRLARWAPGGREDNDDGFPTLLSVTHDAAETMLKFGTAFGEVLGKGWRNEEG